MKQNSFLDKFTEVAMKLGTQIHLRSLRDAFSIIMPFFILAGVSTLINSVILANLLEGEALSTAQIWGRMIANGTLNISSLLVAPAIAFTIAKNRGFENQISAVAVAITTLVIMMPMTLNLTPVGGAEAAQITGVLGYNELGTKGMFAGIIVGIVATECYIKLASIKALKINLGPDVPEMVGRSFSVMIPVIITLSVAGLISFALNVFFTTDLIALVSKIVQEPLRAFNTSLIGTLVIYSTGNLLFALGIHQSVINSSILMPLLLVNTNENMLAYAAGQEIPYILNSVFVPTFGMIGGTGSTICLIIATIIFGKSRATKDIARLATAPGIFNINEPVIFGFPIVFNLPMMIPFVLLPAFGIAFAYFATVLGFMNHVVVMIPWTTPPLLSAYLATGGDFRAVIVQLIIIAAGVVLYLPFMKISERVALGVEERVAAEAKTKE